MNGRAWITLDGAWKEVPIEVTPGLWSADESDLTGWQIVGRATMRVDPAVVPGGGQYHVLLVCDPRDRHRPQNIFAVFWDRPSKLFVKAKVES